MSLVGPVIALAAFGSLTATVAMAVKVATSTTLSWWWVPAATLGAPVALAALLAALVVVAILLERVGWCLWALGLRRRHRSAR